VANLRLDSQAVRGFFLLTLFGEEPGFVYKLSSIPDTALFLAATNAQTEEVNPTLQ